MIWCWGISINISCNVASRGWGFLGAIIMRWTLCPKMSKACYTVDNCKLTSRCAYYCFADSSEMCSGMIILGLVLSLVFEQKGKTTDLNTSSMYTWLIKCPSIITRSDVLGLNISISRGTWRTYMYENLCLLRKLNFAKNGVQTSKLWHGFTKLLWAPLTQIKRHYKEKWSHYTIVKFKSL